MDPAGLVELFRRYVDDVDDPYLFQDEDLYAFMDEAQKEFARLTDWFQDTVQVDVFKGEPEVCLPQFITKVRSAHLGSDGRKLRISTPAQLDEGVMADDYGVRSVNDWSQLKGDTTHLVLDLNTGKGRLVGIPDRDDALRLSVYRLPKCDIVDEHSKFEVLDSRHQRAFRFWMAAQAYGFQDADAFDGNSAETNRERFLTHVLQASREQQRRSRPAGVVRYGGY